MPSVPTFIINLEHDLPRREHMQQQLAKVGMQAEFIAAVDGRTLSDADRSACDRARTVRVYGSEMEDTEIGCYLSHYRLYECIVREDIPVALIMEDDLDISPNLPRIIDDVIASPSPRWLVVRLESVRGPVRMPQGAKFMGRSVLKLRDGELYRLGTHVLGLGAYLIRKEGAARMLDYGRRIFMPIDHTMDRYWENGIVPYLVRPIPVWQSPQFESRIGVRPDGRHLGQPLSVHLQHRFQRVSDAVRKRLLLITG